MPQNEDNIRDPVCGMQVRPDRHAITHQQMHFAFCSSQCKERFLADPHLYIGHPGHKAPAQEGRTVLKHRQLKLDKSLPDDLALQVFLYIKEMMGIENIEIKGDTIDIQYDLIQVTEAQIESALAEVGATLGHSWSERLRRAFVYYFEETEISSLEVSTGDGGHNY
ncbi:MAG: YHS domain-containing protein [Gammaproteobacteria bacterium]|nr:YHS domain-containing protein [Gammaproteobacteria bacterium]